jgi:hypothetical protein
VNNGRLLYIRQVYKLYSLEMSKLSVSKVMHNVSNTFVRDSIGVLLYTFIDPARAHMPTRTQIYIYIYIYIHKVGPVLN